MSGTTANCRWTVPSGHDQSKLDTAILPHLHCSEQLGDNFVSGRNCSSKNIERSVALLRMQVGPKCPFTMSVRPRRKRRTLAVGREGRALHARTGTRRKRRSFAAFRARERGGEIAWESTAGSGPAPPSRRPIYLRHSQSPLCLPLPPSSTVCYRRRPRPAKGRVGRVSFHPRRQGKLSTYARAGEIDG